MFLGKKILRNVLLFISYPINMQQLMTKKYKSLCFCWGHSFYLQHSCMEIVLTHSAWGLLLLRMIFPMVN